MEKWITLPMTEEDREGLRVGDYVYLSGIAYTARDAAHKRLHETLTGNGSIPFPLENAVIYYLGPTPAREGQVIGSAGPTTSSRMDRYTPLLLDRGLAGMIGKGRRGKDVIEAIVRNKAVYFAAVGGAGALLSKHIAECETIAYEDLGTEAIRKIRLDCFPVIVAIDAKGRDIYDRSMMTAGP